MTVMDALRMGAELCDAIAHAHEMGILHLDLTPKRVLLTPRGATVVDFGVARASLTSSAGSETDTGAVYGTGAYMSPEVAMGDARVDGKSDVYSLGCVLYHALAGVAPGSLGGAESAHAVAMRHLTTGVPRLAEIRSTIPPDAERAVMAALSRVAADRPTARELGSALR
jgi:serine/threonine-protein kinase